MAKDTQDIVLFAKELSKLMSNHGCYLMGNIRVNFANSEHVDLTTHLCEIADSIDCGNGVYDRYGPFLKCTAEPKQIESNFKPRDVKITLMDVDKLLANGVLSPITQQAFHNRRDYKNHLKQHGCVEIGNDFNKATEKKRQVNGDFECRNELAKATHQIMEKYAN